MGDPDLLRRPDAGGTPALRFFFTPPDEIAGFLKSESRVQGLIQGGVAGRTALKRSMREA